ncbi:MAG: hypothetical protein ABI758_01035 [Candidatus Woesebacteria bacterium]
MISDEVWSYAEEMGSYHREIAIMLYGLPGDIQFAIFQRAEEMFEIKRKRGSRMPSWAMIDEITRDLYLEVAYYEATSLFVPTNAAYIQ